MKKQLTITILFFVLSSLFINLEAQPSTDKTLTKKEAKKWFKDRSWLNGAQLTPHKSIDHQEFARQYQLNKLYWDKAFAFLKEKDLQTIVKGKYPIDGENVYASAMRLPISCGEEPLGKFLRSEFAWA